MKTQSLQSVVCCAALLITTVPPMARAEQRALALTDAEPQYANHLCWAAADVLAVNQFYPSCPSTTVTSTPSTPIPPLFPTSQALVAGYQEWYGVSSPDHNPLNLNYPLSWYLGNCEGTNSGDNFQNNLQGLLCNNVGIPPLYGLTYKWGKVFDFVRDGMTVSKGLDWDTMREEIRNGRPVLFEWNYYEDDNGSLPLGKHQLVATGYSDEIHGRGPQYLLIWDPWPVPIAPPSGVLPACGPAPGVDVTGLHSHWIPFSTYTDPQNDHGIPATALHDWDQWHLEVTPPADLTRDRKAPPLVIPPDPYGPQMNPPPPALREVSFDEALTTALPLSRQIDLQVSGAPPRTLGVAFPIVGLGLKQLVRAQGDPTALLAGRTSAILFPVESKGEVVDAFLMLFMDGRWQLRGYANVEITRRLVQFRAHYAKLKNLPVKSFYMVSVPGEVAFFAAYGNGKKAILIPVSMDPVTGATPDVAVPAEKLLPLLIKEITDDLRRYQNVSRGPVRPGV